MLTDHGDPAMPTIAAPTRSSTRSKSTARLKRIRAVELLSQGLSYDEIARQVGFSHRGSAHRAVSKALDERAAADIDQLRDLEGSRLDALQAALWDTAMSGDVHATSTILRIIEHRIRLLRLDTGPVDDAPGHRLHALIQPQGRQPKEGNTDVAV